MYIPQCVSYIFLVAKHVSKHEQYETLKNKVTKIKDLRFSNFELKLQKRGF